MRLEDPGLIEPLGARLDPSRCKAGAKLEPGLIKAVGATGLIDPVVAKLEPSWCQVGAKLKPSWS